MGVFMEKQEMELNGNWKLETKIKQSLVQGIAQNEWLYESCALPLLLYCAL